MPTTGVWFDVAGTYPVEARPLPGYEFVSWSGPVANPLQAATTVQLNSNVVLVANFQEKGNDVAVPALITLITSVFPGGSGKVGIAGNYNVAATNVLADGTSGITAVPFAGWTFSHWVGTDGEEIRTARPPDAEVRILIRRWRWKTCPWTWPAGWFRSGWKIFMVMHCGMAVAPSCR